MENPWVGPHLAARSQQSLNSDGSNEMDDKKMAKVILDFQVGGMISSEQPHHLYIIVPGIAAMIHGAPL